MSRWKMASFYSLLLVIIIVSVYGCKRKEEKTVSKEEYISTEETKEERPSKEEAKEGADILKVTASYPPEGSVLSLEGTAPREININQPYEYSVTVTNLTKMPVRNVEVIQHLPQKFQIKSSDPTMREGVKNGTAMVFRRLRTRGNKSNTDHRYIRRTRGNPDMRRCYLSFTPALSYDKCRAA